MSKRKNELLEIPEVREEYFSLCSHPIVDVHKLAEFFKRTIDERYTKLTPLYILLILTL